MEIARKGTLLIVAAPPFFLLLAVTVAFMPLAMASINWLLGGKGGFWLYFNEAREEIPAMYMDGARKVWAGVDSNAGKR